MKKLLLTVLSLLLVVGVSSCGTKTETATKDKPKIEVLNYESKNAQVMMEYVVQQWEELFGDSVEFTIRTLPFSEKLEATKTGDYEISFSGWGPDYAWPTTFTDMWTTGNDYNEVGYSSEAYDALALGEGKDAATAFADLQKAEEVLLNDAAIIPVYQRSGLIVQNPELTGVVRHSVGPDYTYIWADKNGEPINLLETEKMPSMDSMLASDAISFLNINNLNEGLVRQGKENGSVVPAVAKEWSFDEETMTYTFQLRDDAMWTDKDGNAIRPVKASDFTYAWDRAFGPDATTTYGFVYDVATIESYEADDDANTFKVTVKEEKPYFLSMMAFGTFYPVNAEFVEEQGDSYGTTLETTVTNGAFYLSKWDHSSEVVWTKNENYWDKANVTTPAVNFRVIEQYDPATGVALFNDGAIDRVGLSGEFVEQFKDDSRLIEVNEAVSFYFMINLGNIDGATAAYDAEAAGNPLLDNVKIRQALAMSFDKAFICDELLKNGSIPADYLIPQGFAAFEGEAFEEYRGEGYLHFDQEAAKTLFEEGFAEATAE